MEMMERIVLLQLEAKVDGLGCVRNRMIYGNETRLLLADVGLKFERADIQMIKWMCVVFMKDRNTSEKT